MFVKEKRICPRTILKLKKGQNFETDLLIEDVKKGEKRILKLNYSNKKSKRFLKLTGFAQNIRFRTLRRINTRSQFSNDIFDFKNPLRNFALFSIQKQSSNKLFFIFEHGYADWLRKFFFDDLYNEQIVFSFSNTIIVVKRMAGFKSDPRLRCPVSRAMKRTAPYRFQHQGLCAHMRIQCCAHGSERDDFLFCIIGRVSTGDWALAMTDEKKEFFICVLARKAF